METIGSVEAARVYGLGFAGFRVPTANSKGMKPDFGT